MNNTLVLFYFSQGKWKNPSTAQCDKLASFSKSADFLKSPSEGGKIFISFQEIYDHLFESSIFICNFSIKISKLYTIWAHSVQKVCIILLQTPPLLYGLPLHKFFLNLLPLDMIFSIFHFFQYWPTVKRQDKHKNRLSKESYFLCFKSYRQTSNPFWSSTRLRCDSKW